MPKNASVLNPQYKKQISELLKKHLQQKQKELSLINLFGKKAIEQLLNFTLAGKMIRGSLILYVQKTLNKKITNDALFAAAAIELIHSGLLIHDDIIDNDTFRRNQKTIAKHYEAFATTKNFTSPIHFGESMGICVADISFFLGLELLSKIKDNTIQSELLSLCTKEFIKVGTAQMQDIYMGYTNKNENEQTIENTYKFKTARYTISLPLMMSAILTKKNGLIKPFEKLGEQIGLLFQLTDDKLNFFGNDQTTDKSDIRENKKTMYRYYLYKFSTTAELKKLNKIFGYKTFTKKDLPFVMQLITTYEIEKIIDKKIANYKTTAEKIISSLPILQKNKNDLSEFVEFIHSRTF